MTCKQEPPTSKKSPHHSTRHLQSPSEGAEGLFLWLTALVRCCSVLGVVCTACSTLSEGTKCPQPRKPWIRLWPLHSAEYA